MAVIYTAFEKTKHHLPLSSSRSNLSFNNTVTSGHVSKSSRRCMTSRRKRNREKRERERERERERNETHTHTHTHKVMVVACDSKFENTVNVSFRGKGWIVVLLLLLSL
jgi:hypothetical protein